MPTLLKETISHHKDGHSDLLCVEIDHLQSYDQININILSNKLKRIELPEQVTNIIEYMCRNTFVNTAFGSQPREIGSVGNGTRHGGITSGFLIDIYII